MNDINPFLLSDSYKVSHHKQYPKGTELVYSNFTPRSNRHAPQGIDRVVSFGQQMVAMQIHEMFNKYFFKKELYYHITIPEDLKIAKLEVRTRVCNEIKREYSLHLGMDYDVSHIEDLWDLGYLPIKIKALPEGGLVKIGVPVLTIVNTNPKFFWLTNFLETLISNLLWKPLTSATIAYQYKKNLLKWAKKTDKDNVGFVDFQGHDFSMRGLSGVDSVIASGLGHATSFKGSDSLPVIHGARKYYNEKDFVIGSVNATEHSVMSAGGSSNGEELQTFRYLMEQIPTGILSIVSDTWDLWTVLTEYLPVLKPEIMARDGKIVIRPDSGDPVDIICGENPEFNKPEWGNSEKDKGVIELLWNTFGGTINEQGYKVLDSHIGCIYGDSITLDRAEAICARLEAKGFASTNVVLGIGSFTYQYNTRDTFGYAMKATYVVINGVGKEIFKDPVTDGGDKKSAKGLLQVLEEENKHGEYSYVLKDQVSWKDEENSFLKTIFEDGKFYNQITLTEIRNNIKH